MGSSPIPSNYKSMKGYRVIEMMKYKGLVIFLVVCLALFLGCITSISIIQNCNQQNEIPFVEIYPNSLLVDQTVRDFGSQHMATLKYVTSASVSELLVYFDEKLDCTTNETRTSATCRGTLPNGGNEYFIYISPDVVQEPQSSYSAEISWQGCSWTFQMSE